MTTTIPSHTPNNETQTNADTKREPFKSIGYKAHNELTYRGVDWLMNSAVGVGFTYLTNRTEIGKYWLSGPATWAGENVIRAFTKNEYHIKKGGYWGNLFLSIMAGGTAIIPVMMYLENKKHKKSIIHKIDSLAYSSERICNDPRFKEQDKLIDSEPEKDFKTGMIARGAALAPLLLVTMYPPAHDPIEKHFYNGLIGNNTKKVATHLGIAPKKLLERGEYEIAKGGGKKWVNDWDFLHRTIGFDFGLTIAYAYLHEKAFKFLAKKKQRHDDHFHGNGDEDNTYESHELPAESTEPYNLPEDNKQDWQQKIEPKPPEYALSPAQSHQAQIADARENVTGEYSLSS